MYDATLDLVSLITPTCSFVLQTLCDIGHFQICVSITRQFQYIALKNENCAFNPVGVGEGRDQLRKGP